MMYGIEWAKYSQAKNKTTNLIRKSKRNIFARKLMKTKEIQEVFGRHYEH